MYLGVGWLRWLALCLTVCLRVWVAGCLGVGCVAVRQTVRQSLLLDMHPPPLPNPPVAGAHASPLPPSYGQITLHKEYYMPADRVIEAVHAVPRKENANLNAHTPLAHTVIPLPSQPPALSQLSATRSLHNDTCLSLSLHQYPPAAWWVNGILSRLCHDWCE